MRKVSKSPFSVSQYVNVFSSKDHPTTDMVYRNEEEVSNRKFSYGLSNITSINQYRTTPRVKFE